MDKAKQLRMVQQMFGKKKKSKSSVLKDRTNNKRKKFSDLEKKSSKKKKRKVRFADVRFEFLYFQFALTQIFNELSKLHFYVYICLPSIFLVAHSLSDSYKLTLNQ